MAISRPFQIYPRQASVNRGQKNKRVTVPPPVGGWNSRDEPGQMPATDAGDLINLIPRHGFVEMRGGYASHSTGIGAGDVDLCTEFYDGSTRQLITASATNVYNSTAVGAATSLGSGFTNGRWDTAIMDGVMGLVNGADTPQTWDGTTLGNMTVSGPTVTNLIGVHVFKGRSYFWEEDDQSFWYSATNALGGALTEFQLGEIAKKGGKLLRMTSWTRDGGSGPDDFAVFIMDTGETIVYQGDDPGTATSWGLVGIYDVGRMVNDRAVGKLGGGILVVTENDIATMPEVFARAAPQATKLSGAISDAVSAFGSNDGWQVFHYPNESLMMINVPVSLAPDSFEQYIFDTRTGSPARFTGLPSRVWGIYDGDAYFGSTNGVVYRFNSVTDDLTADIDCTCIQAWNDFGLSENKTVKMVRPHFEVKGAINLALAIGYDFVEPTVSSPSSTSSGGTPWGSSWGSPWSIGTSIDAGWKMASNAGSHTSLTLKFSRQGDQPRWLKTDYIMQAMGNLL